MLSRGCVWLLVGCLMWGCGRGEPGTPEGVADGGRAAVEYGAAYRETWRDGNAELASYGLTYPRYGELRTGTAAMVTVAEPFNPDKRVKSDGGGGDTYGVLKMNLAEDFQTGVYDYNLMTSVFVATEAVHGLPAGSATKISFSSQEWCGQTYQQAWFGRDGRGKLTVEQTLHSYFEREADRETTLNHPAGGLTEDALVMWARGLAGPKLETGERIPWPVYRSMAVQRLEHRPAAWEQATLGVEAETTEVTVPAGSFVCRVHTVEIGAGPAARSYRLYIDAGPEHGGRLVMLRRSDGYSLELRGVERLPYWGLNRNADEQKLESFGLKRRGSGQM
ncbi:MAG: hypothetical protein AAGG38_06610 [Planctomycetota bacterium]